MTLAASVLRTMRRHGMLADGSRVLVALSGGPDSIALLDVLRDLERAGELTIAGLAHFNHQLRPGAADEDEAFCRGVASSSGIPIEVGGEDVRGLAFHEGRSIEDAARTLRYAFLQQAADRLGADVIAVGHSRDDQAETFLLRIFRGAGTRGLGGIRPRAGRVIRPLIELARAELRQFAAERGLTFREDESNQDVAFARNRVRLELLPYLERTFGGDIAKVLAREANLAQVDNDRLEAEAIELAGSLVLVDTAHQADPAGDWPAHVATRSSDDRIVIDAVSLVTAHPALASRVVRDALARAAGSRFIGSDQVARLMDFARKGRDGEALSLPGQRAVRHGRFIRLGPEPRRDVQEEAHVFRMALSIPGEIHLEPQRLALSACWAEAGETPGPAEAGVWVSGVEGPLWVRSRQPGDRFQPPGMAGRSKKLQDYLVDRKVARAGRDFVPLVVDSFDRIVWVVGHGVSEAFRAREASPGVILLKVRRLGGEG